MARIVVNGAARALESASAHTIGRLVEELGLADKRIAVERNGEIVPRSRYHETILCDGDRVEIVGAVGGG